MVAIRGALVCGLVFHVHLAGADALVDCDAIQDDNAVLQDRIDAAEDGDVILVRGTCQLDGGLTVEARGGPPIGASLLFHGKDDVTLQGWVEDDDGDGRLNEDWLNGVDEDADGFDGEDGWDAVLVGVRKANDPNQPAEDCDHPAAPPGCNRNTGPFPRALYNRGLAFISGEGNAVRDVWFEWHSRGVSVGSAVSLEGDRCSKIVFVSTVKDSVIERCRFSSVGLGRGVQMWGEAEGTVIAESVFEGGNPGVLVFGGNGFCVRDEAPFPSTFFFGRPREAVLRNNRISRAGTAIITNGAIEARILDNDIVDNRGAGIATTLDVETHVLGNWIIGSGVGVRGAGASREVWVADNTIVTGCRGLQLVDGTSGFLVEGNRFVQTPSSCAVPAWDIDLGGGTSGNVIIVAPGTRVRDFGDNELIISSP
jgi:hypothetical protein